MSKLSVREYRDAFAGATAPVDDLDTLNEFDRRTHEISRLYPAQQHEIAATERLVDEYPHLVRVGHQLLGIIYQNGRLER